MPSLDYNLFFSIAVEGGLGGNCVLSDETALLVLSLIASETPETLFHNDDGTPLTEVQLQNARDIIDKASNEVSGA